MSATSRSASRRDGRAPSGSSTCARVRLITLLCALHRIHMPFVPTSRVAYYCRPTLLTAASVGMPSDPQWGFAPRELEALLVSSSRLELMSGAWANVTTCGAFPAASRHSSRRKAPPSGVTRASPRRELRRHGVRLAVMRLYPLLLPGRAMITLLASPLLVPFKLYRRHRARVACATTFTRAAHLDVAAAATGYKAGNTVTDYLTYAITGQAEANLRSRVQAAQRSGLRMTSGVASSLLACICDGVLGCALSPAGSTRRQCSAEQVAR